MKGFVRRPKRVPSVNTVRELALFDNAGFRPDAIDKPVDERRPRSQAFSFCRIIIADGAIDFRSLEDFGVCAARIVNHGDITRRIGQPL